MLERLGHPTLLLFLSMAVGAALNCFVNAYSKKYVRNFADSAFYTLICSGLSAAVAAVFIVGDGFRGVSLFTVAMSAVFGLCTFLQFVVHVRTLKEGPLALTGIFTGASGVIPALYGLFALDEAITLWQIAGILLMLVSIFFSVEKEPDRKKASLKWIGWAMLDFLLVGGVGVCQKVHHASDSADQLNEYLCLTFCFVFLYTALCLLVLRKKGIRKTVRLSEAPKAIRILVFAGLANGAVNMLNLFLSGKFDAGLFFPVVNGGTVTATVLLSLIVFRERFSRRRWVGIAFGALSLSLLLGVVQALLRLFGVAV